MTRLEKFYQFFPEMREEVDVEIMIDAAYLDGKCDKVLNEWGLDPRVIGVSLWAIRKRKEQERFEKNVRNFVEEGEVISK